MLPFKASDKWYKKTAQEEDMAKLAFELRVTDKFIIPKHEMDKLKNPCDIPIDPSSFLALKLQEACQAIDQIRETYAEDVTYQAQQIDWLTEQVKKLREIYYFYDSQIKELHTAIDNIVTKLYIMEQKDE